jgi:hypothetical protein
VRNNDVAGQMPPAQSGTVVKIGLGLVIWAETEEIASAMRAVQSVDGDWRKP